MPTSHEHGTRRHRRRHQPSRGRWMQWLQRALWPRTKRSMVSHPASMKERWQAVSWMLALIAVLVAALSVIMLNGGGEDASPIDADTLPAAQAPE
jgi:hypothetical protein